ncbi:MAG: hypothetical protein ABR552_10015 [Actinomycetota bacterium]
MHWNVELVWLLKNTTATKIVAVMNSNISPYSTAVAPRSERM